MNQWTKQVTGNKKANQHGTEQSMNQWTKQVTGNK